jgi:hypothetical protein
VHIVKALVDVFQLLRVRDKLVHPQGAVHVVCPSAHLYIVFQIGRTLFIVEIEEGLTVNDTRQLGTPLDTAKRAALPHAPSDELEWPSGNLSPGGRDANDGRDAPAFVAALEGLAHDVHLRVSLSVPQLACTRII